MSLSSRESKLAQLREALAQSNSEFFLTIKERRSIGLKIQELKDGQGRYSNYDPERELEMFTLIKEELKKHSLRELLAFSLVMEDQAQTFAPGAYPNWSQRIHLIDPKNEMVEMMNPLLIKVSHPELFSKLKLASDFAFLKDL